MAGKVLEITDDSFQADVLDSSQPVLVDFWAPWCGPCRMITPTIEELAGEFDGKVVVGKVNIDDNQQRASEFDVRAIPTVLLFKNGEVVDRFLGVTPKEKFAEAMNGQLA